MAGVNSTSTGRRATFDSGLFHLCGVAMGVKAIRMRRTFSFASEKRLAVFKPRPRARDARKPHRRNDARCSIQVEREKQRRAREG